MKINRIIGLEFKPSIKIPSFLTLFWQQKFTSLIFLLFIMLPKQQVIAVERTTYISFEKGSGYFGLSTQGRSAPLYASSNDFIGVLKVLKHLQTDIARVSGVKPKIFTDEIPASKEIVIIGTLGKNRVIDKLVQDKKLDVKDIAGKWETFLIQVVQKPLPGVDAALVITGSDKRGTIYGMYDLSKQIGVSPWYWWADVPICHHPELFVLPGRHSLGEPAVKYRGIFINDEDPALFGWVHEKFDGFNRHFYEKVFELMLRLKANYLWPAMWSKSFFVDDIYNSQLADEYGVVIGTSHHEPMMRAHVEWKLFGKGPWKYKRNEKRLKEFWRKGIERMNSYESIVTIGMRGDGDEAMSKKSNVELLEKIVADQRKILTEVTGKDPSTITQLWALYKEVQDYYNKGMRVPDDVTLLLCDDNWGNVRKLPSPGAKTRTGGYGMYYHFDYVGGPRSYKWINTNLIPRIWEQMHLTYQYGVDRIWIVNVGDIKPMEFPIEFFLDYAWDPEKWPAEKLPEYVKLWVKQQFNDNHTDEMASILSTYTKFNARRKPELIAPDTYSLVNYREAETVVSDYNELAERATQIYEDLPAEYKDVFYQLILHPVAACANLNELYVTAGENYMYANQQRSATNQMAQKVVELYDKDAELTEYFHTKLADGKWNYIMSQPHIGYTSWQQPKHNKMPDVKKIRIPKIAEMGVSIEGTESWWTEEENKAVLPEFDLYNQQKYYIEVFNRGQIPFEYIVKPEKSWVKVTPSKGKIDNQQRLWVTINWEEVPIGKHIIPINITGPNETRVTVEAIINNPEFPKPEDINGFVESNGYVSIEAAHFSRAIKVDSLKWYHIPNLGRTLSGMTPFPVTAKSQNPGDGPYLEYIMYLFNSDTVKVNVYVSPTLNFTASRGLRYAISFDDEPPQVVNIHEGKDIPDWKHPHTWSQAVANNIKILKSEHVIHWPGEHILKLWMVDPGIVVQKIVVETKDIKPSYLGPPENFNRILKSKNEHQ